MVSALVSREETVSVLVFREVVGALASYSQVVSTLVSTCEGQFTPLSPSCRKGYFTFSRAGEEKSIRYENIAANTKSS